MACIDIFWILKCYGNHLVRITVLRCKDSEEYKNYFSSVFYSSLKFLGNFFQIKWYLITLQIVFPYRPWRIFKWESALICLIGMNTEWHFCHLCLLKVIKDRFIKRLSQTVLVSTVPTCKDLLVKKIWSVPQIIEHPR